MLRGRRSPVRLTLRPVRLAALCLLLPLMVTVTSLAAENGDQAKRTEASAAALTKTSTTAELSSAYAHLPLSFEPNAGQIRDEDATSVQFLSRGNGYTLYLTGGEAELALRSRVNRSKSAISPRSPWVSAGESVVSSVLRMRLVGASSSAIVGIDELPGKSNYLIGNNPHNWRTRIPTYGQVVERGVYAGIDLRYHGNQTQLEYDFDVNPGANARVIRLALEGARALQIDSRGNLVVRVGAGELTFRKPVAYQEAQGVRRIVASRFVLYHKNQIAFRLPKYDTHRPLVIDPILAYSTYLGGSSIDGANGISVAPDGTAFVAGGTFSTDFPTAHPLQPNAGGPADFPQDAFVSKISADGSTLLYSTYLGGKNTDVANAIAVDDSGGAYVTGTTNSPDFPVTPGAWTTICGGDGECGASLNLNGFLVFNAFVTKLNPAGSALVYSGFLGTYQNDVGTAIALDGNSNAYVTGETGPQAAVTVALIPPAEPPGPFPTTTGAFQSTFGGASDAFVTKIDASGSELLYSSFLGGTGEDIGYGIAADSTGNAYVTGLTYSPDLPITAATALQSAYAGAGDAFLTKVNTNGTGAPSLVYSTYVGGSGLDQGNGIAVDSSGNAYLAGGTTSAMPGFAPPAGGYQPACALDSVSVCEGDAFMAKLNPALTGAASLIYFTYLGGSLADSASGVALDTSGDVYLTGSTVSTNFPTGPSGVSVLQPSFGGGNADAFVAELNPAGAGASDLVYSTYLGGTNTDSGTGIALNPSVRASSCPVSGKIPVCDAYVTGQTCSLDFPLANPLQATPGGGCDAFVSEISVLVGVALNPAGLSFVTQNIGTTGQPLTVTLTNGDAALTITTIAVTGANASDFAETNTCGTSVLAGGQCTISVTFTPSAAGVSKASVTITDSAPGSPQVINLTGSTSTVTLSSSSLAFGSQPVGVTSSAQPVAVTNNGTTVLTISSVAASGDFAETNNCSVPLQPSTNCVINVTYTPLALVPSSSTGALTITDSAAGSPQVVLLTGTPTSPATATVSPATLTFTGEPVGVSSASQSATLTNTGTTTVVITNLAATGDFAESSTCGASLSAGASCTISVTFTPTAVGSRYGTVTITDSAPNSPQTIALAGTGLPAPTLTLSPSSLNFSSQAVGTASAAQSATLTNTGSASAVMTNVTATGDFTESSTCGASLSGSASCTISVTFEPTAVGSRYGTITVTDSAANSPQTIALAGTGLPAPALTLSPSSLNFSSQEVGTVSAAQSVTLTNSGTAALNITSITASPNFSQSGSCGQSVAAGATCTVNVAFAPVTGGSVTGTLTITDNAPGSPQVVTLGGLGSDFGVSVSPSSATVIAGNSVNLTVTVSPKSGFSAAVALSCSGLPSLSKCLASPDSVTPSGTTSATATLTISTTVRSSSPRGFGRRPPGLLPGYLTKLNPRSRWLWLVVILTLLVSAFRHAPAGREKGGDSFPALVTRLRRPWLALAFITLALMGSLSCGGGGNGYTDPTGTPAGTYQVMVLGTSGTLSHSLTIGLTVK